MSAKIIRSYFISKLTVLNEFSNLDRKLATRKYNGTAIVCGGSIAGLLTAKVCSYHFDDVIIVESEEWVTSPDSYNTLYPKKELLKRKRSHVSQYTATHMHLPLLVATLMKWFPNLEKESEKLGGRLISHIDPVFYSGKTLVSPVYPAGQVPLSVAIKRAGFETLVRRLIMNSCKNVRYVPGTVVGLTKGSPNSNAITGVQIHTSEKEDIVLPATLVIDCTGPASAGLRWLKAIATSDRNDKALKQLDDLRLTYNPKQSYYTCEFHISDELDKQLEEHGFPRNWLSSNNVYALISDAKMDNKILGIMRRDKHTLEILLGGWAVTESISNTDDIKAYLSNMKLYKPLPAWLFKTVDLLEESRAPLSIEKSRLAIGDSVMTINPVYGLGSTKACIGALALSGILDKCEPIMIKDREGITAKLPDDFSQRFFKRQVECIEPEWTSYKSDDYAWETTTPSKGDDPRTFGKFHRKFGGWLLELLQKDEGYNDVAVTAGYVRACLAPATDLFSPKVLWKIIKYNRRVADSDSRSYSVAVIDHIMKPYRYLHISDTAKELTPPKGGKIGLFKKDGRLQFQTRKPLAVIQMTYIQYEPIITQKRR